MNCLRKQGVRGNDKIKPGYKKDGVSFYFVPEDAGRGRLLSRYDKNQGAWELLEGNLSEVVKKTVVAEQVMRELIN